MTNDLPTWENAGIEPPDKLKRDGWKKGDRPPAQYLNWQMNRTYLALKHLQETKASTNDLEDYVKNNVNNGFYVIKYGAKTDGSEDASAAIQAAIDAAKDNAIKTGLAGDCTVIFPAGKYRIENQIISSPFVKLKAIGRVIFETYVRNGSALWITPQSTDPTFPNLVMREEWFRAPILNGVDGAFIFKNGLGNKVGNSTAIELGSRADFGSIRPMARYAVTDVSAQYYTIGMKMNHFHHYICSFDKLHLELNEHCVVFGDEGQIVVNSGENIHFSNSVFAGSTNAFVWNTDSFDTHFVNCSFDFLATVFRVKRGYKIIEVTGGHIEEISNRIFINESTHPHDSGTRIMVAIRGTAMLLVKRKMFEATDGIHQMTDLYLDAIEYRQLARSNYLYENWFLADELFRVRTNKISFQGKGIFVQKKLSHTSDAFLKNAPVGNLVTASKVSDFDLTFSGGTASVIAAPELGTNCKAIQFVGTLDSATLMLKTVRLPVRAGDRVLTNFALNLSKEKWDGAITFVYYNAAGIEIGRIRKNLDWLGNMNTNKNVWFMGDWAQDDQAPAGANAVVIEYQVYGIPINGNTVKISCFHVEI